MLRKLWISIGAVMLVLVALALVPTASEPFVQAELMEQQARDGVAVDVPAGPATLAALEGPTPQAIIAMRVDQPVLILKLDARLMAQVEARNPLAGVHAVPVADGAVLVAYHAKSTHLGCRVELETNFDLPDYDVDGDGVMDGVIMDPCSQSMWDPYNRAAVRHNQPADAPLDAYAIELRGQDILLGPRIPR